MVGDSEDRFRLLAEHLSEGVIVIQDQVIVYANPRASEIVDMDLESMRRVGFLHRVHPDDHELVLGRQRRRLAGEEVPDHYEVRLLMGDGSLRWIGIGVAIVPWGGAPAVLVFFTDITQSKQTLQALRSSEERYRVVVDNTGEGIVVMVEDRIVFANPRACEIVRMPQDQVLGTTFLHHLHPDDYAMMMERRRQRLSGGDPPSSYEVRFIDPDGSERWMQLGVVLVPWEGRVGTMTFFSDMTPRRQLEDQLRHTLGEREAILKGALMGMSLNRDRRFQWVNDKFAEMMGYARDDLVGRSTRVMHASEEAWENHGRQTRAALLATGSFVGERELVRRDGQRIWAQLAGRCVQDRDPSHGVIWTVLDITERRRAEDDIREALRAQRELNDLRSRFVAMTSHEFRTPLATILSSAELLRHYASRMSEQDRDDTLRSIEQSVQRMSTMLERVLLIGRADAQMLECHPRDVDVAALCERLVGEVHALHPYSGVLVRLRVDPLRAHRELDEQLMAHILSNLLSNAVKYSRAGSEVWLEVAPAGARTRFQVRDQGIGIPPAEMAHLFASFHRASNVGEVPGTGLGLVIVKRAVEAHGGELQVDSVLGEGSCFTVLI